MSVEDTSDRPVRVRHLAHQLELGGRRRTDALGLGVPGERARALQRGDLALRKARDGSLVALLCRGGDQLECIAEMAGDLGRGSEADAHASAPNSRPSVRALAV